jgi:hypothetical protein
MYAGRIQKDKLIITVGMNTRDTVTRGLRFFGNDRYLFSENGV